MEPWKIAYVRFYMEDNNLSIKECETLAKSGESGWTLDCALAFKAGYEEGLSAGLSATRIEG